MKFRCLKNLGVPLSKPSRIAPAKREQLHFLGFRSVGLFKNYFLLERPYLTQVLVNKVASSLKGFAYRNRVGMC